MKTKKNETNETKIKNEMKTKKRKKTKIEDLIYKQKI